MRALYADIRAGKVVQGGSTITQQLVRNLYISNKSQTLGRKTTEACLAIKLARKKSKQWILTAYMNQVYYGNHAYGIEAAAQTYFSRPARKLTLDQAALLAGLPQAPSRFDPFQRPAQAIARRDDVLRAMLEQRGHHVEPVRECGGEAQPPPEGRPALHAHPRAVLLQLRARSSCSSSTARTPCARAA